MYLSPSKETNMDCYVDADFARQWAKENPEELPCVRSRTDYLFTLGGAPVLWSSKLQTEIALSTMEAEYIAASTALRSFIPLKAKMTEINKALNLPSNDASQLSIVWEDNQAALQLASKKFS